jgi:hypothetical protein
MTPEEVEREEIEREEIERDLLIVTVLNATTLEQCGRAKELIIAWMQEHPKDFGMLDAGEQVAMILDGYSQEAPVSRPVA